MMTLIFTLSVLLMDEFEMVWKFGLLKVGNW